MTEDEKQEKKYEKFAALNSRYDIIKRIGEGGFCEVFKAKDLVSGEIVAIKRPHSTKMKPMEKVRKLLYKEAHVLRNQNHPHVVKFYDCVETETDLFLVIEYCDGGDLFDWTIRKQSVSEMDAARVIAQILSAIFHMHKNGFVHRDIKTENVLLKSKDGDHFLISDFGLSRDLSQGIMTTSCGTVEYSAPELLDARRLNGYGPKVDSWSIGVMAYAILCGCMPFYSLTQNINEVKQKVIAGNYSFSSPQWILVSKEAKEFISKLLICDPHERMSIEKALIHPWIIKKQNNLNLYTMIVCDIKGIIAMKRFRCLALVASVVTKFDALKLIASMTKSEKEEEEREAEECKKVENVEEVDKLEELEEVEELEN